MKKTIKIIVDVLMTGLFLYLISYQPGMGLRNHALLGIATFALFVSHHLLNLNWFKTLLHGKYNFRRALLTAVDVLLLAAMLLMMLSSLMISGLVFNVSFLPVRFYWRDIHTAATAWFLIVMAVHLGLHVHGWLKKQERRLRSGNMRYPAYLFGLLIFVFGVYSFVKNGVGCDMLMIPISVPSPGKLMFYIEYLSIIAAVCLLVHVLFLIFESRKKE